MPDRWLPALPRPYGRATRLRAKAPATGDSTQIHMGARHLSPPLLCVLTEVGPWVSYPSAALGKRQSFLASIAVFLCHNPCAQTESEIWVPTQSRGASLLELNDVGVGVAGEDYRCPPVGAAVMVTGRDPTKVTPASFNRLYRASRSLSTGTRGCGSPLAALRVLRPEFDKLDPRSRAGNFQEGDAHWVPGALKLFKDIRLLVDAKIRTRRPRRSR
jgi:hypothetical protein